MKTLNGAALAALCAACGAAPAPETPPGPQYDGVPATYAQRQDVRRAQGIVAALVGGDAASFDNNRIRVEFRAADDMYVGSLHTRGITYVDSFTGETRSVIVYDGVTYGTPEDVVCSTSLEHEMFHVYLYQTTGDADHDHTNFFWNGIVHSGQNDLCPMGVHGRGVFQP